MSLHDTQEACLISILVDHPHSATLRDATVPVPRTGSHEDSCSALFREHCQVFTSPSSTDVHETDGFWASFYR